MACCARACRTLDWDLSDADPFLTATIGNHAMNIVLSSSLVVAAIAVGTWAYLSGPIETNAAEPAYQPRVATADRLQERSLQRWNSVCRGDWNGGGAGMHLPRHQLPQGVHSVVLELRSARPEFSTERTETIDKKRGRRRDVASPFFTSLREGAHKRGPLAGWSGVQLVISSPYPVRPFPVLKSLHRIRVRKSLIVHASSPSSRRHSSAVTSSHA